MGSAEDHIDHGILLSDHLHSIDDTSNAAIFGDPPIAPRIGDQYQVRLPPLQCRSEKRSTFVNGTSDLDWSTRIDSSIPIYWVKTNTNKLNTQTGTDESLCAESDQNLVTQASKWHNNGGVDGSSHQTLAGNERCEENLEPQNQEDEDCEALPGHPGISLENAELEGFLLALYMFGKNLRMVEKFLETRKMGDLLSFYYGKFYRSAEHHRWWECKKNKSRKCISGHRIFTGWRQNELLSRLLPITEEEKKATLLEVIKTFTEGATSLEDYVLQVKGIVGIKALVEAVGVGKGKLDLTGVALDRTRANSMLSSQVPVGKDFSSLTIGNIIKLLTGNYRLSKQKSNDLFWEAVWPRLLAKGWHSEQPKRKRFIAVKQALVFLVPGVKKFSRRKLTRGEHYFDSVSDVLHKVASDQRLLELEADGSKGGILIANEDNCTPGTKRDASVRVNHENFGSSDFMKFTVVDTSLVEGGFSNIRELRCLPLDNTLNHTPSSRSDETGSSSSEEQESVDVILKDHEDEKDKSSCEVLVDRLYHSHEKDIFSGHLPVLDTVHVEGEDQEGQHCSDILEIKPMLELSYQTGQKPKGRKPVYMSPILKRRRLTGCKYSAAGSGTFNLFTSQSVYGINCKSFSTDHDGDTQPGVLGKRPSVASTNYSCECMLNGPGLSCDNLTDNGNSEGMSPEEKPRTRALIDLNMPQFSPDFDTGCANAGEDDNICASANGNGIYITNRMEQCEDPRAICVDSNGHGNYNANMVQQYKDNDGICVDASNISRFDINTEQQRGHPDGICFDARGYRNSATDRAQKCKDPDGLIQVNEVGSDQSGATNLRRASTRHRPPSTKVLESLESGFFNLTKERRSRSSRSSKPRTFLSRKRFDVPSVSYLKPDNCTLEIREPMS